MNILLFILIFNILYITVFYVIRKYFYDVLEGETYLEFLYAGLIALLIVATTYVFYTLIKDIICSF